MKCIYDNKVTEVRSRPAPAALQEVVDRPSVGRVQRPREPATGNEPLLICYWSIMTMWQYSLLIGQYWQYYLLQSSLWGSVSQWQENSPWDSTRLCQGISSSSRHQGSVSLRSRSEWASQSQASPSCQQDWHPSGNKPSHHTHSSLAKFSTYWSILIMLSSENTLLLIISHYLN